MKKYLWIIALLIVTGTAHSQTVQSNIPAIHGVANIVVRYDNTIYIGGGFDSVGTSARTNLAAIDANTGTVLPWNPMPNGSIAKMIIAGSKLVVSGNFDTISGMARHYICVFDLTTGNLLNSNIAMYWSPYTGALHQSGNYVYIVAIDTMGIDAVRRFNLNTLSDDPSWSSDQIQNISTVKSITSYGNYVYVGGWFVATYTPVKIANICRFDIATGILDSSFHFAVGSGDWVQEVIGHDGKIYVGGSFQQIGTVSRNGIAEIDTAGFVTNKNIYCSGYQTYALTLQGNTLWLGGNSFAIGGLNRYYIAQVDIHTGIATCWFTQAIGSVTHRSIWAAHDTVYVATNVHFKALTGNPGYVDLGSDTVLCAGGSLIMNAPTGLTNYYWNNGATTSSITINTPGNYWFSANDPSGCIITGYRVVLACTGIGSELAAIPIQIAPTITTGKCNVIFPSQNSEGIIEVHDLRGNLVLSSFVPSNSNHVEADVSPLVPGMYLCDILWENKKSMVAKLIKE